MTRGIDRRLKRLEAERPVAAPAAGPWFMIWVRGEAELAPKVEELKAGGIIRDGDPWLAATWPLDAPMPAPRWATVQELSLEELEVLEQVLTLEEAT
jgi:hypothetical protein